MPILICFSHIFFTVIAAQDMMAEDMRVGLPAASALFAAPEAACDDPDGSGAPSKVERGRAEGAVLETVRQSLSRR